MISNREIVDAIDDDARPLRPHSFARAIRLYAIPARNAPHLHTRRISPENLLDPRRAPPDQHHQDIIVGFPGETVSDFEDSITLLDEVGYDGVYAFTYSPRPNTAAKSMPDAIPEEEKSRRLAILAGSPAPNSDRPQ